MAIPRNIDVKTATLAAAGRSARPPRRQAKTADRRPGSGAAGRDLGARSSVDVQGYNAEPCEYPSLVLRLKLRNVSDDVAFQPMDNYFDRKWKGKGEAPPLTILELVSPNRPTRFFGGPAEFHLPLLHAQQRRRPAAVGAWRPPTTKVLNPGEEMETFVCTDGDDKAATEAVDEPPRQAPVARPPAPRHRQARRPPLRAGFLRDRRRVHRRRLPEKQLTPAAKKNRITPNYPLAATFPLG